MATIVLSGANRGIGLKHAELFAQRGDQVHALVRDPSGADQLKAIADQTGQITLHAYDAADKDAPKAIASALDGAPVDILFNNAGIYGNTGST